MQNFPASTAGLNAAIAAAESNPGTERDEVIVGSGTYVTATGFVIDPDPGEPIDVSGAGTQSTVLSSSSSTAALRFESTDGSSAVSDMSVSFVGSPAAGSVAMILGGGVIRSVAVMTPADEVTQTGLQITGDSTIYDLIVEVPESDDIGVESDETANFMDAAFYGDPSDPGTGVVYSPGSEGTYLGSFVRSYFAGLNPAVSFSTGRVVLADSIIDLETADGAQGVVAENNEAGASSIELEVNRSTIVGTGPNQIGVVTAAEDPARQADAELYSSVVQLQGSGPVALECSEGATPGDGSFTVRFSALDMATVVNDTCAATNASNLAITPATPLFVDAANGEFRPTLDSPLVDASDGLAGIGLEDFYLGERNRDGDNDGNSILDIGAAEYQALPPEFTSVAIPESIAQGSSNSYSAVAIDPDGEPVSYSWQFGVNVLAGQNVSYAFPFEYWGDVPATVTATDPIGLTSSESRNIKVPLQQPAPAARVRITRTSNKAFRRTGRGFRLISEGSDPAFEVETDTSLKVTFELTKKVQGVRRGGTCTKRKRGRTGRKCTLEVPVRGTGSIDVPVGTSSIGFGGRYGGKKLAAGSYRVFIRADVGGISGAPFGQWLSIRLR